MKVTVIKQLNNTLKVAYNSDYELIKKLKLNTVYQVEIKQPRNYRFLKKFFALINMVYENQETYNNIDDLRHDLIVSAGYYRKTINMQGVEVKRANSVSFSKMNETQFSELYNSVIDVVVKWLGFDKEDIKTNIEQYF